MLDGSALGVIEIVNQRRSHLGIVGNGPDSWFRQSQWRRSQLPDVTNDLDDHSCPGSRRNRDLAVGIRLSQHDL